MPRSKLNNWHSSRRLDYIDDKLATTGKISRQQIKEYFGVGIDIGSVDIGEYARLSNGGIEPASAGWVATDKWGSVRNSTPERIVAWPLLSPTPNPIGKTWEIERRLDWIADNGPDREALARYFGINASVAAANVRQFDGRAGDDARRGIWGIWA